MLSKCYKSLHVCIIFIIFVLNYDKKITSHKKGIYTMRKTIISLLLFCSSIVAYGQSDSANVSKIRSINFDPLFNIQLTNAKGLKFSIISNATDGKMMGAQISGITNIARDLTGIQLSAISNISNNSMSGIQISGLSNISMGVNPGVQVSAIANISANRMKGVQFGMYNYSDTLTGVQVGLFNASISHPKGVQVGLLNYSRDTTSHNSYGLLTIRPNSKLRLLAYGGTSTYANIALEINNRNHYTMFGMGMLNKGFSRFSGTFFYRNGYRFPIGKTNLSLGGDLGFFHIEGFEKDRDNEPDRLYSIQPRITANYRLGRKFSIYAAGGYEFTRFYSGGKYKYGPIGELGIAYDIHNDAERNNDAIRPNNYKQVGILPTQNPYNKKYPWIAAAEVFGINAFVHCFDRWVTKEEFAQTTWHTIGHNLTNGFVWDNDDFKTNQFMHPYHGSLYFTAARSNGMNFWQSYPFALGGSLMWEFFGENTPPSINDVFSTSFGGAAIGESLFRISAMVLDDSSRGAKRVLREAIGFILSPMRGLNRLIHGEAFRVKTEGARYHDFERIPVHFSVSTGARYLADNGTLFRGNMCQYLNFRLDYGDSMSDENKPYDFFTADATLNFWNKQPLFSDLHLLGRLWNHDMIERTNMEINWGLFQHFNFYSSTSVIENDQHSPFIADDVAEGNAPYRISETAAIGPGVIMRFKNMGNLSFLEQRLFINGILMGGSQSDYFRILWRDYNLGSGYSAKINTIMQFGKYARLDFKSEIYHLFTWKGYSAEAIHLMETYTDKKELEYINAQGDPSNTLLFIFSPRLKVNLSKNFMVDISPSFYYRHTHYRDFNHISRRTFELRAGISYTL